MDVTDAPIRTQEEARAFFMAMGCQHMHMARDYPASYEEYRALGIEKQTEDAWRCEALDKAIADLATDEGKLELWMKHGHMCQLTLNIRSDTLRRTQVVHAAAATYELRTRASHFDRVLIAENILGRATYRDDGMIFAARSLDLPDIADNLFDFVDDLLAFDTDDPKLNERRKRAITLSGELKSTPKKFEMPALLKKIVGR